MKWFVLLLFIQFAMWSAPEEPPDSMEVAGPSESGEDPSPSVKDICEDNKSQLETFKDIMLKTKKDLKKKEEELQVLDK